MNRAMAFCKPTKMWIDGKCFKIRKFEKNSTRQPLELNEKYEINTNEEGKLFTSFRLPQDYYTKLLNFPHLNLKILESTTNTSISVAENGNLVITGDSEEKITEARDEIHSVTAEIRDQYKAMQFISIPILSEEVAQNFITFKEEILREGNIKGMEASLFQNPLKLHLTVVVFSLLDDIEKLEAIKALQDYKSTILDPLIQKTGPLTIKVSGIDCMNTNMKKVDVLYANASIVEENKDFNLQKVVNDISDHFYERGLVRRYQNNVKLHMTLINTRYRKNTKNRWAKRQSFDATTIIEKYKDFHFGMCRLNAIHLSLMSSIGDDGFYKPLSIITVGQ